MYNPFVTIHLCTIQQVILPLGELCLHNQDRRYNPFLLQLSFSEGPEQSALCGRGHLPIALLVLLVVVGTQTSLQHLAEHCLVLVDEVD